MKKGKKILALLTAGVALLGGMAFAGTAEAEPLPEPQSSSQSLKGASQKEGVKTEEGVGVAGVRGGLCQVFRPPEGVLN